MGQVITPAGSNFGDGTTQAQGLIGKQGETLAADIHGQFYNMAVRGKVGKFNRTAVTIPVVANNLVSVFGLYNPAGSGVIAEIIQTEIAQVLATTVVDALGWYFSTAALSLLATFTTPAVANTNFFSGRVGDAPGLGVIPHNAVTHSGTPVRVDVVFSFGAVTDAVVFGGVAKNHNGTLLLPPGILMSLAMSTAAGTASGLDPGVVWAEFPYSAAA